jgi:glucuronate isomerase
MKKFLDEDFLLETKTANFLYHEYAKALPILDFHSHLSPVQIAEDHNFNNLTEAWLAGDHYKWRAMRTNGVHESFCTGNKSDFEKFEQWATTVPYTLRNPLYHWTHLELQRYFEIHELLTPGNARKIYDTCSEKLRSPEFSVQNLLRKMNVEVVATTDDPIDSLSSHLKLKQSNYSIKVIPTFRPDKALEAEDLAAFNRYINSLSDVTSIQIESYSDFLASLKLRHDHFASVGCCISDHGLEQLYSVNVEPDEIPMIFTNMRAGKQPGEIESLKFRSALLLELAKWDHEKMWVQQYHLGAMRKNNSSKIQEVGPDSGWDSIGDFSQGKNISNFMDRLNSKGILTKTIIYNSNPSDNELMASMIGNFNDGSIAGKIQWGSAWWFLDQKEGMIKHLNALAAMGLLSRFVGMVTDSRSFLSYPRHEYFRRILCNLFGNEMESGELPDDKAWVGKIIQDICYYNAKNYFIF